MTGIMTCSALRVKCIISVREGNTLKGDADRTVFVIVCDYI